MAGPKGDKPGNPAWVKGGKSPNPGGRPKGPIRLRERYHSEETEDEFYDRLMKIVRGDDDANAIKAMTLMWERVYGKIPVVDDNGETVKDTQIVIVRQNAKDIAYTPEPSE